MEMLAKALELIQAHVMPMAGTIAVVIEMAMRMIPSEKPMSIAHAVSEGFKMVAKVCQAIGDVLDRVLPQKLK